MCGIFAVMTKASSGFFRKEENMLDASMFVNAWRGRDSTGVALVTNKGQADWIKVVGGPEKMWRAKRYNDIKEQAYKEGRLIFGHGRAATRGEVNAENAHPFDIEKPNKNGKIILVHNGTLSLHQEHFTGMDKHEVDSAWLAQLIAEYGPVEALGKVDGAIATMWYDTELKTFNFFRNHERPLHFVNIGKDYGTTLFNSTREALSWVETAVDLKYDDDGIRELNPRHWVSIPIGEPLKWTVTEIPKVHKAYEHQYHAGWNNRVVGKPHQRWDQENKEWISVNDEEFSQKGNWEGQNERYLLGRSYNPPKEVRSLEHDMWAVATYRWDRVRFRPGGDKLLERVTSMSLTSAGTIIDFVMNSYKPHLVEIASTKHNEVILRYRDEHGTVWEDAPVRVDPAQVWGEKSSIIPFTPSLTRRQQRQAFHVEKAKKDEENTPCIAGKWNRNKRGHGQTHEIIGNNIKQVTKHWWSCGDTDTKMAEYGNDNDGEFKVGQSVTMEVFEVIDRTSHRFVFATPIGVNGANEAKFIECTWHSEKMSKEDILKKRFFVGTIQSMWVMTKKASSERQGMKVQTYCNYVSPVPHVEIPEVTPEVVTAPSIH